MSPAADAPLSPCDACGNVRQLITDADTVPGVVGCTGCGRCWRRETGAAGVYLIPLHHYPELDATRRKDRTVGGVRLFREGFDRDDTTREYLEPSPEDEEC